MKNIIIDKKLERFVKGHLLGEHEDILSVYLNDIGESFYFDNQVAAQDFLNKQSIERFGDKELRTGYFDYTDEFGTMHRYIIESLIRGKVVKYLEEIITKLSEEEMFDKFGYLMTEEHGDDIDLLIDIMKCNGIVVKHQHNNYEIINERHIWR